MGMKLEFLVPGVEHDEETDLGPEMGRVARYFQQLERGEKSPSLNALFDFAGSFGMKPSDLLRLMEGEIARHK
jgi:hypothetical protein